jgi:hypothetical protein
VVEMIERELDHRNADGIDVTLLWDPQTDSVVVAVVDDNESIRIAVDASEALDAFRHPYAYDRPGHQRTRQVKTA